MSLSNKVPAEVSELLGRLMDRAKEMTSKPVEDISESVANKSVSYLDEHYATVSKETLVNVIELLKAQESSIQQLQSSAEANDTATQDIQSRLDQQDSLLNDQIVHLREDNKACTSELKEMIEGHGDIDYSVFDEVFRKSSEQLMEQQRAHAVEIDRMVMGLKIANEKNLEKTGDLLEKKIESTASEGSGIRKTSLIISVINLLVLIGYIIYDISL